MTDQRNLILAIVLSVGIILAFQYFREVPKLRDAQRQAAPTPVSQTDTTRPTPGPAPDAAPGAALAQPRAQVLEQSPRVPIDNGRLHGSIALRGARLDDLRLADYHETVDRGSPEIVLLSPAGSPAAYFVEHGWVGSGEAGPLPDAKTLWEVASGERLAPGQPVVLRWNNGQGLLFERRYEIDTNYLVTLTQTVTNQAGRPLTLYPYGLVSRWGTPHTLGYYILHEGPIGVLDGRLQEPNYKNLIKDGDLQFAGRGGWLGFTDKYWLTAVLPDQGEELKANFRHTLVDGEDRYQADYLGAVRPLAPDGTASVTTHIFGGAKEVDKLDAYEAEYKFPLFDRAVDFGWFYFLTKPMFLTIDFFYRFTGNYGVAILLMTLLVKLLFFPLANKSYRAMSRMKLLQPKMMEIRERYADDRARMNQEMMALYKREKVNPMAGCLPIVVQIPVFFSLYKVLFVSIEMRGAPFFGWIKDLSAPDPTTVFNLFGLIPWTPPHMLMLGALPLLMGCTMFLQTKLNPQPADPMQARVMLFLPVMFTFLFATFPAGLVLYWTWNNLLSIAQQWIIMRRAGVKRG